MPDYIVREEDGTSKLTTEDASGSLLLEDGGVYGSFSADFVFGAAIAGVLPVRVTQEGIEVLSVTDDANARVTQEGIEVLWLTDGADALVTQEGIEVLWLTDGANARLSQEGIEILSPVGGVVPSRPVNDLFQNAITLSGSSGSLTGTNWNEAQALPYGGAIFQQGDPLAFRLHNFGDGTVWYKWTAPADGFLDIVTSAPSSGTPIGDTAIGIYTGAAPLTLTEVGFNDDYLGSPYAKLYDVAVTNGTLYYIEVTGFNDNDFGTFLLNWDFSATASGGVIIPPLAPANRKTSMIIKLNQQ